MTNEGIFVTVTAPRNEGTNQMKKEVKKSWRAIITIAMDVLDGDVTMELEFLRWYSARPCEESILKSAWNNFPTAKAIQLKLIDRGAA